MTIIEQTSKTTLRIRVSKKPDFGLFENSTLVRNRDLKSETLQHFDISIKWSKLDGWTAVFLNY